MAVALTINDRGYHRTAPSHPHMRPFDVQVGDKIQTPHCPVTLKNTTYIVTEIYEHLFVCLSLSRNYRTSFQKKEYQLGMVHRVGVSNG